jgi:hypothetical protein
MGYNQYTGNKQIEWVENENGCYICTSHSRSQKGYPFYSWDKKSGHMSRFIWEQLHGDISKEMHVCHKCDNPSCINPKHLFLGTNNDNVQDKMKKGRHKNNTPKGEGHWWAKITKDIANNIFNEIGTQKEISQKYGVSQSTVSEIKSGKRWVY